MLFGALWNHEKNWVRHPLLRQMAPLVSCLSSIMQNKPDYWLAFFYRLRYPEPKTRQRPFLSVITARNPGSCQWEDRYRGQPSVSAKTLWSKANLWLSFRRLFKELWLLGILRYRCYLGRYPGLHNRRHVGPVRSGFLNKKKYFRAFHHFEKQCLPPVFISKSQHL